MENSIEINNLSKSFKDIKAVNDLSFKVKKGEFFAFLGVNGAGKSTTISIMCGQLAKDSGSVIVNGKNIEDGMNEIRKEIGVVFQSSLICRFRSGIILKCVPHFTILQEAGLNKGSMSLLNFWILKTC